MPTYIDSNVAHDLGVIWEPYVFWVVLVVFAARRAGLIVDNEGALHINAYGTRVQDSVMDIRLRRGAP